jgi:Spy/CpxP family protein refolding chaperone
MNKRMIIGVLAIGTLLVVAYAFAQGPGGPEGPRGWSGPGGPLMHGGMMRGMIARRLDRALDRASVTPEQRVKIYAARDRVFAAFDAQPHDSRARRDRMLALFEGNSLTTAQLDAAHQQEEQQRQRLRAAIHQAVVDVHDTLTPAQRKVVAEYMRTHGPLRHRGHRPGGMSAPADAPGTGGPGGMR